MNKGSAIKWRLVWINTWILGIIYLVIFIAEDRNWGTHNINWVFGTFFLVYALIYYARVRVYQILVVFFVLGLGFYHTALYYDFDTFLSMITVIVHIVVWGIVLLIGMPVVVNAYKLEIYSRKIFKLAAEQVHGISEGFTSRPYSAGSFEYKKEEIIGFARFLTGKDIARYRIMGDVLVIGLSMGISPIADPEFDRISTITFGFNGNLFVHISEHDYNMYREKLSFDQLCESLSKLLIEFLEYYRNGREDRIIVELKNV